MLFSEPLFLFAFLPPVFLLTWRLRRSPRARLAVLFLGSLGFYLWGEPRFVPVVVASAGLDFVLAPFIARGVRGALVLGLGVNLAVLVFYKYLGFLADTLFALIPAGLPVPGAPRIALPIGVSFIVFEKITYLVDVWRGLCVPAARFGHYLLYVLFFPKLLAGPIIKYHEIQAQLETPPPLRGEAVTDGFARFMLGVVKKVLIADIVGGGADRVFALPVGEAGFAAAWAGIGLFTLQIYLDFSAYSDMAIGLAGMFGFHLRENFDRPYASRSITEFWRRWHISLTSWIREYLYIPLGGNRVPAARRLANLWICFLLSGLWHGASWTYVLWGGYNGLFLTLDRLFLQRVLARWPGVAARAATLLIVMVGWAIFRAASPAQLAGLLGAAVRPGLVGSGLYWENSLIAAAAAGVVISLGPAVPRLEGLLMRAMAGRVGRLCGESMLLGLFAVALDKAVTDPFRPFLYFRF